MYYIRKSPNKGWMIRNNNTGSSRALNADEVEQMLIEFPNLKNSSTVTYFINKIKSITDLP